MSSTYPSASNDYEGLLFVTSSAATDKLGPAEVDRVKKIVGDRLFNIPGNPQTIHQAAPLVVARLQEDDSFVGVVILGDYETVPSRLMFSISSDWPDECPKPDFNYDHDKWWVWSDDLYGDNDNDRLAELPVSRIPIVPEGGLLGANRPVPPITAFGVRGEEFDFAEAAYQLIGQGSMDQTPPAAAMGRAAAPDTIIDADDLDAPWLYFVLHGSEASGRRFRAKDGTVAVNLDVAGAEQHPHGVIFAGVCWGGLTATSPWVMHEAGGLAARDPTKSIPLTLIKREVNAFVGFTALHYIPNYQDAPLLGAPLHSYFWQNILCGLPPSLALFRARVQFVANATKHDCDTLATAFDMKTFWSATCLGLGW